MTCIVGVEHEGAVYMGADGAAVDQGWNARPVKNSKIFILQDKLLIGYTGSFRLGQILQHTLKIPTHLAEHDDLSFIVRFFVGETRRQLKDHGHTHINDNSESTEGDFLLGYKGKLYKVQTDLSVLRHMDGFDAVGIGAPYALGALAVNSHLDPEERVSQALHVAAKFSTGVGPPYAMLNVSWKNYPGAQALADANEALTDGTKERMFKIQLNPEERVRYPTLPPAIPWSLVEGHQEQAMINHSKTLEQLNEERGGLDVLELCAVLKDLPWREYVNSGTALPEYAVHFLLELLGLPPHGHKAPG